MSRLSTPFSGYIKQFATFLTLIVMMLLPAGAQTSQATIAGVVSDSHGAAIAGASVTATNDTTGVVNKSVTNGAGAYSLPNLAIGEYTVAVERDGFSRSVSNKVLLSTGQVLGLNTVLKTGSIAQSVTVQGEHAELETRSSDIGQIIESKSVADLPLGSRSTMNIVSLTGGAVFIDSANYSLAGGRTKSSMTWLDGGSGQNIRIGVATAEINPPVDTIQELGIITNNYAAEYGGSAGGVIVQTTRSGGNQFHGTLYEFIRNDYTNAPGYFATTVNGVKQIPELRHNIYGGTIGGPIQHNRTFFFFGYEGTKLRTGSTVTLTVPTDEQRGGDFSTIYDSKGNKIANPTPIYDPSTTTKTLSGTYTRTQFPGNKITNFDSVANTILAYFPVSTNKHASANNFVKNTVSITDSQFYLARVDHVLTEKDRIAARYIFTNGSTNNKSVYPDPGADPFAASISQDNIGYGQWVHTVSPTVVNDLRFTFETRINHALTNGVGGDYATKLKLNGVSNNAFPNIAPAGYSSLGSTSQERRQFPINQYQLVDDISLVLGRHSIKLGAELRRSMDHEINLSTASGSFTFDTTATGLPGNTATGDGFASFLVGFPTAFSEAQTDPVTRTSWYLAGFAQDDFTLSHSLTLNLGLRWETDTPIKDENNRMNGFDAQAINPVSNTPGVVKFMGVNGFRTTPFDADYNNFAPRVGFAWQPFNSASTVVRGGFGYFFAHQFDAGQPASAAVGFSVAASLSSPDSGVTAPFYLKDGVPSSVVLSGAPLNDSFGAVKVGSAVTTAVSYFDPRHRTGYSQQFNLGIQHQLPGSIVLQVSGLGNIAHKLAGSNQQINQIAPNVLSAAHHSQSDRPFPQFNGVTLVAPSIGNSNYFAGTVQLEKRFLHGYNLNTTYTYSKFLNDNDGAGSTLSSDTNVYSNYYNRAADYGPSSNDVRHQLVFSSVYELPFGPHRTYLNHGIASQVLGSWTLGNVTRLYTGAPFTVVTKTNSASTFSSGSLRANVIANPKLPSGKRNAAAWFNTAAFAQPANYTYGNEGRNSLRGPGYVNFDFSLIRNVHFTESKLLQIRGEFFNVFNHTNLQTPASTFGAAGFGTITSSNAARQIQIGARLVF